MTKILDNIILFPGKENSKLIVGENAAVCNDCVELCVDILKDELVLTPLIKNGSLGSLSKTIISFLLN